MTFQPGNLVRCKNDHGLTAEVFAVRGDWFWGSDETSHGGIKNFNDWELAPQPIVEWAVDFGSFTMLRWHDNLPRLSLEAPNHPIIRRTTHPDGTVEYCKEPHYCNHWSEGRLCDCGYAPEAKEGE